MEPKGETDDMGALSPHHMDCARAPLPSRHYHQARPSVVGQLGVSWTGLGLLGHEDMVPAQREGRDQPGGGKNVKSERDSFPFISELRRPRQADLYMFQVSQSWTQNNKQKPKFFPFPYLCPLPRPPPPLPVTYWSLLLADLAAAVAWSALVSGSPCY